MTWLLAFGAMLTAALVIWRLGKSGWWRALLAILLALYLAHPVRREAQTAPRKNTALLLVDHSGSMTLDSRGQLATSAAEAIQKKYPDQHWQVKIAGSSAESDTKFERILSSGLDGIAPEELSGIVLLTDGLVHDAESLGRFKAAGKPINVVIVGNPDAIDRKLSVIAGPPFALVGSRAKMTIRMDDAPGAPPALLTWSIGGQLQSPIQLSPSKNTMLPVPITRRGPVEISLSVPPRVGEITTENNQALVNLNGVRDRLKVLLVSGAPYPGGRLWRDTLKSDPSIDLIHFTILRLPSSFDMTPNSELSLIPFPVDQLFEQRLHSFDLIIFDSFGALDLLDPVYFTNVSDFVKQGGALFMIAGPEFGSSDSLSSTALADVLPLQPTGVSENTPYLPKLSPDGKRHPITALLDEKWGQWFQQARVHAGSGTTLLTGVHGQPLVQIADVGKGRVGMIASNQLWVWARGEPPGPWSDITRRMAHWLMREPDLESEKLTATSSGKNISIKRNSLTPHESVATVIAPDGSTSTIALSKTPDGAQGNVKAKTTGIYRISQNSLTASVIVGGNNTEFRDVRPTDRHLEFLATSTGGTLAWLKDGIPALRFNREAKTRIIGMRSVPLFPAWLALLASLSVTIAMWLFERK
jgi:hypothetical protein